MHADPGLHRRAVRVAELLHRPEQVEGETGDALETPVVELWMAERWLKEEARQLDSLGRFVDRVRQASRQRPVDPPAAFPDRRQEPGSPGGASAPGPRNRELDPATPRRVAS